MNVQEACPQLEPYACQPEDLFSKLDARMGGVALVELPDSANPQGLVNRFAELVDSLGERAIVNSSRYMSADQLIRGPFYLTDTDSVAFAEEYEHVYGTIKNVIAEAVRKNVPRKRIESVWPYNSLSVKGFADRQGTHTDYSTVTAWLGATNAGYEMDLPDGGSAEITNLPAHHVLVTRQAKWQSLSLPFRRRPGINHSLNWRPKDKDDSRAVGLSFFHF